MPRQISMEILLSIPAGKHTLQFSMVGMESKEIMVDGNKEMAKLTVVIKPAEE